MKKITKIVLTIALCFTGLFAFSFSIVNADEDAVTYEYDWSHLEEDGMFDLIITINEFYDSDIELKIGENINNMLNEYAVSLGQSDYPLVPGDHNNFNVIIKNKSGVKLNYKENSLVVGGPDMSGMESVSGAIVFDGQTLATYYTPTRTANIRAIYSGLFDQTRASRVTFDMMASIDAVLAEKGYYGAEAYTNYLLDYYNDPTNGFNQDGIVATTIETLDDRALKDIRSNGVSGSYTFTYSDMTYDECIASLNEQYPFFKRAAMVVTHNEENKQIKVRFKEDNPQVAAHMYNYFYETCYQLKFNDVYTSKEANSSQEIMNGISSYQGEKLASADSELNTRIGSIPKNDETSFNMGFAINGPFTTNVYMSYPLTFNANITLEKEVLRTLAITKTIDYGNYETSDNPLFIFKATNNETNVSYYRIMLLNDNKKRDTVLIERIPIGTYTVTEFNPIRYSSEEDKTATLTKESMGATVQFENRKTKDNDFSSSSAVINSFTKDEDGNITITPEKVEDVEPSSVE